jgi:N-acetylneuraminic acid mutarotase
MVWTGTELLVWGGYNAVYGFVGLGDGAAYDPASDTWRPLSSAGAPQGRWSHSAVWTGSAMIVFGGIGCGDGGSGPEYCQGGGRYDPVADRWDSLSLADAPSARNGHSAVWTGHEMIVWGGGSARCQNGSSGACGDGAAYDPDSDRWRALAFPPTVGPRSMHVAVWTGTAMLVWGGAVEAWLHTGLLFTPNPGPRFRVRNIGTPNIVRVFAGG